MATQVHGVVKPVRNVHLLKIVLGILTLYGLSLVAPAVPGDPFLAGCGVLYTVWVLKFSPLYPAYSSNLFLVVGIGCLLARRFKPATVCACFSAGLGLTALPLGLHMWLCYSLWQSSFVTLMLGGFWAYNRSLQIATGAKENGYAAKNRLDVPPPLLNGLQESSRVP